MESGIRAQVLTRVGPESTRELHMIADTILQSMGIVVLTGAGISTNAGIPANPPASPVGFDLYHTAALSSKANRPSFLSYYTRLRQFAKEREVTPTHLFIRELCRRGQLIRNYTQNIDDLERKAGLNTDLQYGAGTRRGERGIECVQLHGSLRFLRRSYCNMQTSWDEYGREAATLSGQQPACSRCSSISMARVANNKRASNPGTLRPNIVLYDEVHPWANETTEIYEYDLTYGNPNILLILGTRLRISGVKATVKKFARTVHEKGGLVIYVNLTCSKAKEWNGVIDYWIEWDCDSWVEQLMRQNPKWQSSISKVKKSSREDTEILNNYALIPSKIRRRGQRSGSTAEFPIDLTC
ncbi:DHS-like NAD/FAD-binding domain-containing protein [Biscogniauxia mediterranea]|nr:DHS-like NAD/FAD-binding domain-containing protein [Biscogniauxia mediterranea]